MNKGHQIKQVCNNPPSLTLTVEVSLQISQKLKDDVPDEIRKRAQEMAKEELRQRLKELDMSPGEAKGYGALFAACEAHIASLTDLLEREYSRRAR